eukprot:gnl/MRDRNA2_/MRDRNA2_80407_c0_seq2.p1 gnl/MRDRNA2_/MRDRNA2_80407_c0~~gnl/MRDRNA2_/MRDRNA2_80407_c0_seq2.p1  ORF type:complete len:862 (+),score=155.57 gnl/MRDRNA2_/MRDRNA2_80407_c0_seq2:103-2586(+)
MSPLELMKSILHSSAKRSKHWIVKGFTSEFINAVIPALELFEAVLPHSSQAQYKGGEADLNKIMDKFAWLLKADDCTLFADQGYGKGLRAVHCNRGSLSSIGSEGEQVPQTVKQCHESGSVTSSGRLLSVPFVGKMRGVIYCERLKGSVFAPKDIDLLVHSVAMSAPVITSSLCTTGGGMPVVPDDGKLQRCRIAGGEILEALASGALHLDALLDEATSAATRALDCQQVSILLYSKNSEKLKAHVVPDMKRVRRPSILSDPTHEINLVNRVFMDKKYVVAGGPISPCSVPTESLDPGEVSVAAVPVIGEGGQAIGVLKAVNPVSGAFFGPENEAEMSRLAAQVSFLVRHTDIIRDLNHERNFSEATMESITNGVITVDKERKILKANSAALKILKRDTMDQVTGIPVGDLLGGESEVQDAIASAIVDHKKHNFFDHALVLQKERRNSLDSLPLSEGLSSETGGTGDDNEERTHMKKVRVNLTVAPLMRLQNILAAYGQKSVISSEAGSPNHTPRKDFEEEIKKGTSRLRCGNKLLRIVDLVVIRLTSPKGDVLVECSRTEHNPNEVVVDMRLPAVMKIEGEDDESALRRCVEIKLPPEAREFIVYKKENMPEYASEIKESKSYKGMMTQYNKAFYEAVLEIPKEQLQTKCKELALDDDSAIQPSISTMLSQRSVTSGLSAISSALSKNSPRSPRSPPPSGFSSTWDGSTHQFSWLQPSYIESMGVVVYGHSLNKQGPQGHQASGLNNESEQFGGILLLEDISHEKRILDVMSRYMNPNLAKKLIDDDADALGGREQCATMLFSDIRSFLSGRDSLSEFLTVIRQKL